MRRKTVPQAKGTTFISINECGTSMLNVGGHRPTRHTMLTQLVQ
jgi:hypothetical protein